MTAIVISGAMMVQLRNVRVAVMVLELGLRIKYFGFRSDSNLVIRPCCCPSRPDSLRRVFTSVLISSNTNLIFVLPSFFFQILWKFEGKYFL